jgi:hypothetical protein
MLGEDCNWIRSVRATDGRAVIHRRRRVPGRLTEVPIDERAPIIKRYLTKVPGGRSHLPVHRHATAAEFQAVAARYPVFRVLPDTGTDRSVAHADPSNVAAARTTLKPPRGRRRWRGIAARRCGVLVTIVVAGGLYLALQLTEVAGDEDRMGRMERRP